MKIAQIAPLYESVPPTTYGGTERVVSYLTDELVRQNHDVTLFASGDSVTIARLESVVPRGLRLDEKYRDPLAHHTIQLDKVSCVAQDFDIIHFHMDYLHFPVARRMAVPYVTTLHGRLDLPDLEPVYRHFYDAPVVSISNAQRGPLPFANWQATIYHGIPENLYTLRPDPGGYLAFLGRIAPEKRPDRAIEIAVHAGMEIKIAAKVDKVDQDYFETRIKPLLNHPLVNFIGEINEHEKDEFLGNAYALLFPIDWPEPFGLVMIEAMACGTPTIAYRGGSVPEVLQQGMTGFIVSGLNEALDAVEKVGTISRRFCRREFERRFSVRRMAHDYAAVYQKVINLTDNALIAV